jgi:DNA-binding MarR family transcriptional regulator
MDEATRRAALSDLYALPGHLLWRAAARVTAEVERMLPAGIDLHAYGTLVALADLEPQSQRSLADMIGVSATTLTSVAQTLQRDALVERVRNPGDRRSYSLTRTPAGRSAVRRWAPHVDRLEHRLTATLGSADAARLRDLLVQVVADQLDPRTPAALLISTAFLVSRAQQRAHRDFAAALQPLGIEPRHFGTLRALRVVGPATQHELGTLLDVSPATVVQIVDHLEQRGLVTRERDGTDRRVHRLHLTPDAVEVVARATAISSTCFQAWVGSSSSRDHQDLVRLLRLLLAGTPPA